MPGPVPGSGSPSQRLSSLFFRQDLCDFIVVQVNAVVVLGVIVVAWWVRRGGAFGAVARATTALMDAFYVRHQGKGGGAGGGVRGRLNSYLQ